LRHCNRPDQPRNCSADGDFVRDDEMLEVDEGGRDNERDENPVSDRDLPWETFPNDEEEKSGEQRPRNSSQLTRGRFWCHGI
jgi:hypothetical protein